MAKNREKFMTFFPCKSWIDFTKCVSESASSSSIVLFAAGPIRADCPLTNHNRRESSIKYNFSSGRHRCADGFQSDFSVK